MSGINDSNPATDTVSKSTTCGTTTSPGTALSRNGIGFGRRIVRGRKDPHEPTARAGRQRPVRLGHET